jgi:hypothetical protein
VVAVRATLTASLGTVALVAFVVLATEAAPRMDNVCRSVDARGNVRYGDCPPATTYKLPQPVPPPLIEEPPPPKPIATVTPAEVDKPARRTLAAIWTLPGATSRKTYPIAGVPLLAVGMVVALISSVSFLVGAFRVSLWWGLGCLFVAPVTLVFLLVHWKVALRPFLLSLAGLGAALVGYYWLGGGI